MSSPDRDAEFGIAPEERRILTAHVPETQRLAAADIDRLADRKMEYVFKPRSQFASRGLLDSAAVGRARLRRLVRGGEDYVVQRRIDKGALEDQWAPPLDGPARLGLSERDSFGIGARVAPAGSARPFGPRRLDPDLRPPLTGGF